MSKTTGEITTIAGLGRQVRRSPSTVHGYLSHPAWRWGRGPWSEAQVREINEWIPQTFSASHADPELTAARVELLKEQLAHLNLQNGVASGEWCLLSKVQELAVRAVLDVKRSMIDLPWHPSAIPPSGTEAEIFDSLTEYIHDATTEYEKANARIADEATAEADPVTLKRRKVEHRAQDRSGAGAHGARAAGPAAPRARARAKR